MNFLQMGYSCHWCENRAKNTRFRLNILANHENPAAIFCALFFGGGRPVTLESIQGGAERHKKRHQIEQNNGPMMFNGYLIYMTFINLLGYCMFIQML